MPIVTVKWYEGRSRLAHETLAKRLIDAVSEVAVQSAEGVQVIFDEVSRDRWAIGPGLFATGVRPQPLGEYSGYLRVGRLRAETPDRSALADYRERLCPLLSGIPGHISSTLIAPTGGRDQAPVIIEKWADRPSRAAVMGGSLGSAADARALHLLGTEQETIVDGEVLRTFVPTEPPAGGL